MSSMTIGSHSKTSSSSSMGGENNNNAIFTSPSSGENVKILSGATPGGNATTSKKSSLSVVTASTTPSNPMTGDNAILSFPQSLLTSGDSNTSYLQALLDENSSYAAVTKSCFQFCQYAGNGSSSNAATSEMDHTSVLFHDPSYVQFIQTVYPALMECMQGHKDRRSRILACQTLALLARSAYAQIRPSPLIFSQREPMTVNRIEDEMSNEIPNAIISIALYDDDDGVAACAIEALGTLTMLSCPTVGRTLIEDELLREIQTIAFGKISVYSPTLRSVTDEDPLVAIQELQCRIYENTILPRLLQLTERIVRFQLVPSQQYIIRCLPVLTACLIHNLKSSPAILHVTDRTMYSKNWYEVDAVGLIDTVIYTIIIPAMQKSETNGCLAHCASLQGIRLAHACCTYSSSRNWVNTIAQWAVIVLKEELQDSRQSSGYSCSIEDKIGTVAKLLIALRAIPIQERLVSLIWIAEEIHTLPSTTTAPVGISSAGLLMECYSGCKEVFRRPTRIGLWTEIALSFFIDGPSSSNANSTTSSMSRSDCLKAFLASPYIVQIFTEIDLMNNSVLYSKDEMLLAFTTVAVQSGRRFRCTIDGSLQVADPNTSQVQDWLKLAWVVLTSFVSCVHMGPPVSMLLYLDEDLSLITACLASYVQLLQEYLHFVGLLNPMSSVALKLGANACPPHILWDQMTESADFLCKFQSTDLELTDSTTKLMEELISRELRQGIPSHHMRLFIVSLAADHWVQGRVNAIRKHQQQQSAPTKIDVNLLNTSSAREILLALGPKRLLAKISKAHVPPVDSDGKPKRDPIKKLALECVRVCVACIENIALIACEWRRRFGSSQESKHIVNVAVGLLQGKIDETVPDELAKSVIGPSCEAAIARIQAYYEEKSGSGSTHDGFPQSELVSQQVKVKIKPLVSSTKPAPRKRDVVMRDYLMQLCRQIVLTRSIQCIQSCPPADSMQSSARPQNCWFRLSVPPMPESKDGRLYGHRSDAISAWGKSVTAVTAGSDPAQVVLAYTLRRMMRYDGEEEYRLTLLMRAHNMTAVDFEHGLRLEIGMIHNNLDPTEEDDPLSLSLVESLDMKLEDILLDVPSFSSSTVFKDVIKPAEYITWEVTLDTTPSTCCTSLLPTVVFRNISIEPEDVGATWVGDVKVGESGANAAGGDGESTDGESDFQVTTTDGASAKSFQGQNASLVETDDVRMPLQTMPVSPMIRFQPCPLVFFSDRCGDADSFRLMWFRMPYNLAPIKIVESSPPAHRSLYEPDKIARKIARMAELLWEGEAIPGGTATKLWAFMTLSGYRVYCVLTESESSGSGDKSTGGDIELALHFRADDKASLYCVAGSKISREAIVEALVPGMVPQ